MVVAFLSTCKRSKLFTSFYSFTKPIKNTSQKSGSWVCLSSLVEKGWIVERHYLRVSSPHLCSGISLKCCINLIFFSWFWIQGNFKSVEKLIWFRFWFWLSESQNQSLLLIGNLWEVSSHCHFVSLSSITSFFTIKFSF